MPRSPRSTTSATSWTATASCRVRAVATSAVREARNVDVFLDRIHGRTGIAFEIINEAEESRLVFLAVKQAFGARGRRSRDAWTLLTEVGGGSTSLTLLRRGQPNRSGVYALGAVRLRQQLDLRRLTHDVQVALLKRSIANVIEEIRLDIPLQRVTHMIAIGGDVRFAASQILEGNADGRRAGDRARRVPRLLRRARAARRGTAGRSLSSSGRRGRDARARAARLSHAAVGNRGAAGWSSRTRRSEPACCSTSPSRVDGRAPRTSNSRCWPAPRRSGTSTGSIAHMAATSRCWPSALFDEFRDEHGLSSRERLLLQVAALLHDIGRLREPARAPQALAVPAGGVADLRPVERGDGDRLQHRAVPSARDARRRVTCPTSRSIGTTV